MAEQFGNNEILSAISPLVSAFSGDVAIFGKSLVTGDEFGLNADAEMPTASIIKVWIMAEAFRQADAGSIDLGTRLRVEEAHWYGGTGTLKEFLPGVEPTVIDLVRLMIVVSDNVATRMLVPFLGLERINQSIREWGFRQTEMRMRSRWGGDIRDYAVSSAREIARVMELIATDALVSPAASAEMRGILRRQQHLEQIPRDLPYNHYMDEIGIERNLTVYNKIGSSAGMRSDVAYIETIGGDRFVLATINEHHPEHDYRVDHPGNVLNGRIGRIVFDAWTGGAR